MHEKNALTFWKFWWNGYLTGQHYLAPEVLQHMTRQLRQSPYLQQNVLNQRFSTTEGFSLLLKSPQHLPANFDYVKPFFEAFDTAPFNYFYMNVLQLNQSAHVDRHVDHSIRGYDPDLPLPGEVLLVYLQAEGLKGGDLLLYRGDRLQQRIVPKTGDWVRFKGHKKHAITALESSVKPRLSLVCELYTLSAAQRALLPNFVLKSTAGFDTFLQQALPD